MLTKHSPFLSAFNHGLDELRQSGMLARIIAKHMIPQTAAGGSAHDAGGSPDPLGASQAVLAFVIGGAIWGITCAIFVGEFFHAKFTRSSVSTRTAYTKS